MSSIDFLNSICSGVKAAEAPDYKPHPLGEFHGKVMSVENKYIRQAGTSGNSVIELKIHTKDQSGTKIGVANHNEWLFSNEDLVKAQSSQEEQDKLKNRISRIKRLFVDLGVYSQEVIDSMVWSNPNPSEPGVLESFDLLNGKLCSITVKANTKPNKPAMIFVNAPVESVIGVTGAPPQVQKASSAPMAPNFGGAPGPNNIPFSPNAAPDQRVSNGPVHPQSNFKLPKNPDSNQPTGW